MTALPLLEILLRKTIGQGIPSSSQIVQHFTLWAGFLGALLASREDKHLSLSTAELLPAGTPRRIARFFTHVVAGGVSALLCAASVKVVDISSTMHEVQWSGVKAIDETPNRSVAANAAPRERSILSPIA